MNSTGWRELPRSKRYYLNPYEIDIWKFQNSNKVIWKYTILNTQDCQYVGAGEANTEAEAQEDSINRARNLLHPITFK